MQRLPAGPLTALLPAGAGLWVDGAHNPAAATAVAPWLATLRADGRPLVLIAGLLANKDAAGVLAPIAAHIDRVVAVPVPGHASHDPDAVASAARSLGLPAETATGIHDAIHRIAVQADPARPPHVLILGSLYLAGTVLAANGTPPD